jgi:hypothetical protein
MKFYNLAVQAQPLEAVGLVQPLEPLESVRQPQALPLLGFQSLVLLIL